jgi:hypothetical protein
MSSLYSISGRLYSCKQYMSSTYKLEEVARSICSSSALVVEEPNQPAMVLKMSGPASAFCSV